MLKNLDKAPFPWFGGKSQAAPLVWELMGDCPHYCEPFFGSGAVLLNRPHPCNRPYVSESVNDADGLLVNAWRSIQWHPHETAEAASWPVSECVPAGTMIATPEGDVPVEDVRPGMTVLGHDGTRVIPTVVMSAWNHLSCRQFVRLGPLVMTDNHPVWTAEDGYLPAGQLTDNHHVCIIRKGDMVCATVGENDGTKTVSVLRQNIRTSGGLLEFTVGSEAVLLSRMQSKRATPTSEGVPCLLQAVSSSGEDAIDLLLGVPERCHAGTREALFHLRQIVSCEAWQFGPTLLFEQVRDNKSLAGTKGQGTGRGLGGTSTPRSAGEVEGVSAVRSQPNQRPGCTPASIGGGEGEGIWPLSTWWQSANAEASASIGRSPRLGNRSRGQNQSVDWEGTFADRKSNATIQVHPRHRRAVTSYRHRSGWAMPQKQERTRRPTRCEDDVSGLDGATVHESRDTGRSGGGHAESAESRRVYNLQTVSGNYFAAGILVHNCDKTARQIAILRWRTDKTLDLLAGSPEWCDPRMAGWWLWGVCCQIGAMGGPWTSDPVTGRIFKQPLDGTREPGVSRDLPHLGNDGRGVNRPQMREPGMFSDVDQSEYHPMTMPELRRWFLHLSARLRHVRILNGDWKRLVTTGAAWTLPVRQGKGPAGIFLDPPYDSNERADGLYADGCDEGSVAAEVREWCKKLDPTDKRWRVVLAGYDTEHAELEALGWTVHEWFAEGHLKGGYGNIAKGTGAGDHQQHRERLWASPQCLAAGQKDGPLQMGLFGDEE